MLSAERDLKEVGTARTQLSDAPSIQPVGLPADVDEAVIRRLVDVASATEPPAPSIARVQQ